MKLSFKHRVILIILWVAMWISVGVNAPNEVSGLFLIVFYLIALIGSVVIMWNKSDF